MRPAQWIILAIAGFCASCATLPVPPQGLTDLQKKQHYSDDRSLALPPTPAVVTQDSCAAWQAGLMAMTRDNIAPLGAGRIGEFYRPELMAIGDSLFNGVQSLRINWFLSEWSAPSLVAMRLGLIQEQYADRTGQRVFYTPQYRSHGAVPAATESFGFNLEDLPPLTDYPLLPGRVAEQLNGLAFGYLPPNGRPMVDNIAYLSATSYDLLHWTPWDYKTRAHEAIGKLRLGLIGVGSLPGAVTNANAAFVLNPTRNACLDHMTPVEQVALRHPRRLLVSIGANDGMYSLAFSNQPIGADACSDNRVGERGQRSCSAGSIQSALQTDYIANMRILFDKLAKVEGLEAVYLDNLPLPSRTANLVPILVGADWYWYNDLMSAPGDGPGDISRKVKSSAASVQAADTLVDGVNKQLQGLVDAMEAKGGTHFTLVDVNARLATYDAKRCDMQTPPGAPRDACKAAHGLLLTKARFQGGDDVSLDNRPIRFDGTVGPRTGTGFKTKIAEGGLLSFDNMHLTTVGYEIMADEILAAMRRNKDRGPTDDCPMRADPAHPAAFGACAALLVTPGWSYEDPTRRDYSFLRTAGLAETNDREVLSRRIDFVGKLLHLFPDQSDAAFTPGDGQSASR